MKVDRSRAFTVVEVNSVEPVNDPLEGLQCHVRITKLNIDSLATFLDPLSLTQDKRAKVA